jgi:tyrosine-specific transport protein
MKNKDSHVLGGTLLVAGSCIGAGMLGLPVLSALAGFEPSVLMFTLCWLFMTCTGLLLLEVNLWFTDETNLITLAERTLGRFGKIITWVVFLFLFYCLMVAYASASGELFSDFFQELTPFHIPDAIGSLFMTLLFGFMVYLGTEAVDKFNRWLMLGLVVSYLMLMYLGASHVNTEFLKTRNFSAVFLVIPAMIVSFGFHNLVPSITTYLNHDVKKLKTVFIAGSLIPLIIYIAWEWLLLGMIPLHGDQGFHEALSQGNLTTKVLKANIGGSFVVDLAQYFAFFAIVTSFLGVALSFVDFLSDGLHIKKTTKGKIFLSFLALAPPFIFSLIYPKIFLLALNYAGSFGAVILFGILPALMVWSGRYFKKIDNIRIVPGGRLMLTLVLVISVAVIILQVIQEFA